MLISNISIKRPVFAMMVNLAFIVFGLFSLPRLAIDQMPDVDFPVVTVTVIYPGADPESIEQRVLDPLENSVNGLPGLKTLTSNAFPNIAQIVLQFDLEIDSTQAAQSTRDRIFSALGELPKEAETPIVQKFDVGGAPIMNIAVETKDMPIGKLSKLVSDQIQPALERIEGVASAPAAGVRKPEIHILLDLDKLGAYGLGPQDISNSLAQQNLELPGGRILTADQQQNLRVTGKPANVEELGRLPISTRPDLTLRIQDVATIVEGIEEESSAAYSQGTQTILLAIQKQSGANTTSIADDVRSAIKNINSIIPKNTKLSIVTDNSIYIKGSIDGVKLDLLLGALLATIIVWLFLQDFRITLISAASLPTAVISTFALIDYMGFTLNMMSTLALSLSIGILIDDAIVVIENIHRHLSLGKSRRDAAAEGTSEIGLAVFATTLTLCAVFVPVAFMDGIIGRFFYQFGLTVAFAVLVSLFVAFTLTPMLASKFLSEDSHSARKNSIMSKINHRIEKILTATEYIYRKTLEWCMKHRFLTVSGGGVIFILSIALLTFIPVSFFPREDRSEFDVEYILPEGSSLELTKQASIGLGNALKAYPGVNDVVIAVGSSFDRKPNVAKLNVKLVAKNERNFTQFEFMDLLRKDLVPLFAIEGAELTISEIGGGGGKRSPIQFVFMSNDWEKLKDFSIKITNFIKEIPGAVDVSSSIPKPVFENLIRVDPVKSADLGLSSASIATIVRSLFESQKVSELTTPDGTIDITMRARDKDRADPSTLESILIRTRKGAVVPLGSVANISRQEAPSSLSRQDGRRQITVTANYTEKDLNKVINSIQKYIDENHVDGVDMALAGTAQMMKESIAAMLKALGLAIILVYMILCAQYDRYMAPLVIMAALPLSLTGAFGALLITGGVISVYTMIGIILLMGLVTKNGILLIDFALQKIREGIELNTALIEAGVIRLRPILMTTFAAGGGMLPVAIGHGVGGEAKSPMGIAVIGGLLMSTALTLVVVPCLFSLAEGVRLRLTKKHLKI